MESFKANFIVFIFVSAVLVLGYWAVQSINSNNVYIIEGSKRSDIGPVVTSDPGTPVTANVDTTPDPEPVVTDTPVTTPAETDKPASNTPSGANADLISKLQGLIDDKILMKKGSRGTRVGTVQQFLRSYGIKITLDNDYGDTTVNGVKKFQIEQKLPADGQAGATTYQKMIDWLKAH